MEWKEIGLPALNNLLSTGAAQPLVRELWPTWAQNAPGFAGAWFTPLDAPPNTSTESLATGGAQAFVEMERVEPASTAPLRYYGYFYCQMTDGRTFQLGPIKELEYERHRTERPDFLKPYKSTPP
jgi:hypothetical protein